MRSSLILIYCFKYLLIYIYCLPITKWNYSKSKTSLLHLLYLPMKTSRRPGYLLSLETMNKFQLDSWAMKKLTLKISRVDHTKMSTLMLSSHALIKNVLKTILLRRRICILIMVLLQFVHGLFQERWTEILPGLIHIKSLKFSFLHTRDLSIRKTTKAQRIWLCFKP